MFWSRCPDVSDVERISTLIGCRDTFCVTQIRWLRRVTPHGKSSVYRFRLVFGLISNQFRNVYISPTLVLGLSECPRFSFLVIEYQFRFHNEVKQMSSSVGLPGFLWEAEFVYTLGISRHL